MMPAFDFAAGSVLIASADGVLHQSVLERIEGRCAKVERAAGGAAALARLEQGDWRFLFLDRQLPDLNAEEVRGMVALRFPQVEVVMIESGSSEPDADSDQNPGRYKNQDLAETEAWTSSRHDAPLPSMIGDSPPMRELYRKARLVAQRSTTVLISGPTGCGKELVARAIHALSSRSHKPFVVVNCAAIPDSLVESELFGHVRGAFTGAVQSQTGRIPAAHGGTLFLDEVGDLSPAAQAKLLRFLELREVQRLGGSEVFTVDVRVVAASHRDLTECAGKGEFREDLYYRLAVFPLEVPGLAERRDDIVRLAEHVLKSLSAAAKLVAPRLSAEARQMLLSHPWRGNVRELQHVMERASILSDGKLVVDAEHICFTASPSPGALRVRAAA